VFRSGIDEAALSEVKSLLTKLNELKKSKSKSIKRIYTKASRLAAEKTRNEALNAVVADGYVDHQLDASMEDDEVLPDLNGPDPEIPNPSGKESGDPGGAKGTSAVAAVASPSSVAQRSSNKRKGEDETKGQDSVNVYKKRDAFAYLEEKNKVCEAR